jgi:hypothetical protein
MAEAYDRRAALTSYRARKAAQIRAASAGVVDRPVDQRGAIVEVDVPGPPRPRERHDEVVAVEAHVPARREPELALLRVVVRRDALVDLAVEDARDRARF